MVSFWPFRGDANDAASFEKILSQLSTKINKASAQNESFRQRQRRYKVLWTLYTTFAYILVALILTLVTGWEKWGPVEYTALGGSPVLIYSVRTALDAYYNYRLSNSQTRLNALIKQREAAIEKLKTATKYNSTQQLLEKYGASPPNKSPNQPSAQPKGKRKSDAESGRQPPPQANRTGFAPPATANIPSRQPLSAPPTPQQGTAFAPPPPGQAPPSPPSPPPPGISPPPGQVSPNAFHPPPTLRDPSQYAIEGPKWYDRILDIVLGEDETQARNRVALICQSCRLVNGQAPPGVKTLEDVGKWRCSACHAWNGVESEEKRILKQISQGDEHPRSAGVPGSPAAPPEPSEDEEEDGSEELEDEPVSGNDKTPAASTRSQAKQRKKAT
jgi:hypothetical protein